MTVTNTASHSTFDSRGEAMPLSHVFDVVLPKLLRNAQTGRDEVKGSAPAKTIGFVADEGPETGYWVVSLREPCSRGATPDDHPDVLVRGRAEVLLLLFAGGLDVGEAVRAGALSVKGDFAALSDLAAILDGAQIVNDSKSEPRQ